MLAAPATVRVTRGDSVALDIFILRSKETRKAKVKMGMSSGLPKGVAIRFEPGNGNIDQSKTIVSVADSTPPGTYNLIFNATIRKQNERDHCRSFSVVESFPQVGRPTTDFGAWPVRQWLDD